MVLEFFRAKILRSGANGGDARGYRIPLGGAIVGTLAALGLRVKTLDHLGLDNGGAPRCYPIGGVVVESHFPWACSGVFGGMLESPCTFIFSTFSVLCKRYPSSLYISSIVWLYL